jgi:hypothetical protein
MRNVLLIGGCHDGRWVQLADGCEYHRVAEIPDRSLMVIGPGEMAINATVKIREHTYTLRPLFARGQKDGPIVVMAISDWDDAHVLEELVKGYGVPRRVVGNDCWG